MERTEYFQSLADDINHIRIVKTHARKALRATIVTVGWSFILIPLMNKSIICNDITYILAWMAVVGVTASGITCLRRYRPLVLDAMKPTRARRKRWDSERAGAPSDAT